VIFAVYARGDWMPFGRFLTPIWPLVALIVAAWAHSCVEQGQFRVPRLAKYCIAEALLVASFFAWLPQVVEYRANAGMSMLMRGSDQTVVGRWLAEHARPGSTVATIRLGGISYEAPDLVFWDRSGLTDREQAAFIAQGNRIGRVDEPVLKRSPDILAMVDAPAAWAYTRRKEVLKWVKQNYLLIQRFPQGNFGTFDIWVRKTDSPVLTPEPDDN
jgi:hypothetical protein